VLAAVVDLAEEYEALIQFLYLAPVGLAQISLDGQIGMSAGVAATDDHSMSLDALMKRAKVALYAAKAAGRDRFECWSSSLDLNNSSSGADHAD
jgi:GGDEF domain-containing protein